MYYLTKRQKKSCSYEERNMILGITMDGARDNRDYITWYRKTIV